MKDYLPSYRERNKTDWVDGILATLCGCVLIYIIILIGSLFSF